MKRLLFSFCIFNFALAAALAGHLYVPVQDRQLRIPVGSTVTLTPRDGAGNSGAALITIEAVSQRLTSDGCTFSNLFYGRYYLDVTGRGGTRWPFTFPDTNATLNVITLITNSAVPTPQTNFLTAAQTQAAIDAAASSENSAWKAADAADRQAMTNAINSTSNVLADALEFEASQRLGEDEFLNAEKAIKTNSAMHASLSISTNNTDKTAYLRLGDGEIKWLDSGTGRKIQLSDPTNAPGNILSYNTSSGLLTVPSLSGDAITLNGDTRTEWPAGDISAASSNNIVSVPDIQIIRGTNRVAITSWSSLQSALQDNDIVQLGRTNYLDQQVYINRRGVTVQGLGQGASWIGTVTNGFVVQSTNTMFQDFSVRAVVPHDLVYGNTEYPFIGYLGPMTITNCVVQRVTTVGPYSSVIITGTNNVGLADVVIRDCDFTGFGTWNGSNIKVDRCDTNSTVLIQRNTLTHTSLGESTNVQMYGSLPIRAQYGNVKVQDSFIKSVGYHGVTNTYGELFVREQIGIYLQNANLTVENCKFIFEGEGPQPPGAIFREGGTLTFRSGGVASEDIHNNATTYGGYTVRGGDLSKIGTAEVEVTGTNGVFVQQYSFRDMPSYSLSWSETNRSEWYPQLSAFYSKSNTFGGLAHQTNASISVTNGRFILNFWATNGVCVTNVGGTNFIAVRENNEPLVVSNTGPATLGGIAFGSLAFDSTYANPSATVNYTYPDHAYDYANGGTYPTNLTQANKALYSPSNFVSLAVSKVLGTRRPGVWNVETFETAPGRKLRIDLSANNPITNDHMAALNLSGRQFRTSWDTNVIYCIEAGSATALGTYTWSGFSYTNASSALRVITNYGGYWRIMQSALERYTNASLFGLYSTSTSGVAPAGLVIPSGTVQMVGSVIISNPFSADFTVYSGITPVIKASGTTAIVGGLTNASGGPLGQASMSSINRLGATRFDSNAATANVSVVLQGQLAFGATNAAPGDTATADRWVDVDFGGTTYRMPLYTP